MRLERAPFIDQYIEDGEAVILLDDGRLLAVSPLVAEMLHLIENGIATSDELSSSLVQTFGAPPSTEIQAEIDLIVQFVLAEGLVRDAQN